MALTRAQIQTAFQNSLGRAANANEENSFFSVSQSGALTDAQVFQTISNSREADIISDPIVRFYQAAFGRVPDAPGFDNWQDNVRALGPTQATYIQVATLFTQQAEFTARFGTGTTVDAAYVQALYTTILGRNATAAEIDGYVSGAAGYTGRGGVLYAVSQSQEAFDISNNAVNGFLNNAAQGTAVYQGTLYTPANGQPNIPGAPVNNLTTGVDNFVGTGGNDVVNGFIDTTASSTASTFTVADTINGGAGTDSLNVLLTGTAAGATAVPLANVTNVENFFIRNLAAGAATFNAAAVTGEQQVWNDRSTAAVQVTGLGTGATIGVRGDGNTTLGATTVTYANDTDAVTIAIDGGTKGTAGITRTNTGAAAVTINSTGAANTVGTLNLDGGTSLKSVTINATTGLTAALDAADFAAGATLKLTGAGVVDLGATTLAANITTIDASGLTSGVKLTSTAGGDLAFTGGSGNDRLDLGGTLTGADTIVGGAGTDTLAIAGADLTGAASDVRTGLNTKVSGFEVLEFTGATAAQITGGTGATSFTNTEITKLLFNTTGATDDVVNQAGSARTYAIGELNGAAGDLTLNLGAGVSTVNVSFEGLSNDATGAGANGANVDALVIAQGAGGAGAVGPVTVNIASIATSQAAGATNVANTATSLNALAGSTFNITGNVDFTGSTLANSATVNASSFTGKLGLTGSAAGDTITIGSGGTITTGGVNGGAGNDAITTTALAGSATNTIAGGAGADAITLNTGTDRVVYTTLTDSTASAPATTLDTLTSFTAGTDKFIVATVPTTVSQGAAFTAAGTGTLATDIGTALAAGGLTGGAAIGANNAAVVTITGTNAGTYLVINDAVAGYAAADDAVIKLAGLSGTLATTDFVTA